MLQYPFSRLTSASPLTSAKQSPFHIPVGEKSVRSQNHVELSIASPAEGGVLHVELHDFITNTSHL